MTSRGKRRSRSQRIGELGESIFTTWALENRLIPQKVDRDYGVDFFAQVAMPIPRGLDEVTGGVLAAQVRSVERAARQRVRLDREDVENALRIDIPFCFFAVDSGQKQVHFLFLDEALIRRFQQFLSTEERRTSIRLDAFRTGSRPFVKALTDASRSGYQERVRILKTELGLARAIPGSRLAILHTSASGLARLDIPWIGQAFDIPPDSRNAVATLVFEEGRLPQLGEEGARFRAELEAVQDLVEGPVLLSGVFEREVDMVITGKGSRSKASHPFMLRRIGDEQAYVDPTSGLVLVISDRRPLDGRYVHNFEMRIIRPGTQPIDTLPNKDFLRRLRAGASLNESDRPGIDIDLWPNLSRVGPAIDAIDLVRERLGIDTSELVLADLRDVEFGMTLTLLDLMLNGVGVESIVPSFVLGPAATEAPNPDCWLAAGFRIPIVANFKKKGLVIWVEGTGDLYFSHDVTCGFRARQQSRWECDVRGVRFTKGANPEVWAIRDWPSIPVFGDRSEEPTTFTGPITPHAVGGELWPLATSTPGET